MKEKNLCGKTRKIDEPYEVWQGRTGYGYDGWEWRVLKKWQSPSKETTNQYARWFCAVKSPFTFGDFEYGDVYVCDIIDYADRVK